MSWNRNAKTCLMPLDRRAGSLNPGQRVTVDLSGLTIRGVSFSGNVKKALVEVPVERIQQA